MLNWIKNNIFFQIYISYVFFVSGIITNFIQLLTLIFIWPFSKYLYKYINYHLVFGIWGMLTYLMQWWSGSDFYIYCTDEDLKMIGKEHAISILNHKYDIDWLMGWVLMQRINILGGSRSLIKSSTKFLPIVGWSFYFNEMLMLKREWESDKKSLSKNLNILFDTPENLYLNISIFCEGTRFTPEKHAVSMEIAKEKGLPLLKHHLLPRTKGFSLLASEAVGKIDYVYDLTLGAQNINGEKPSLSHLKNSIPVSYEIYLRRIPLSTIPHQDEKKCAAWLHQIYREKDEIYDTYVKTGHFKETSTIKKHYLKPNAHDLYNTLAWQILLAFPSAYYLLTFIIHGSWFAKIGFTSFFLIANYAVKYLISCVDIKNASKTGLNPSKMD